MVSFQSPSHSLRTTIYDELIHTVSSEHINISLGDSKTSWNDNAFLQKGWGPLGRAVLSNAVAKQRVIF